MKKQIATIKYLYCIIGFLFFIGLFFISCKLFPQEEDNLAIIPVPNSEDWWVQRHEQIASMMASEDYFDIVFIGGSTTQDWEQEGITSWNALKPQYKIANLGFGGDRTEHALWRLQNGEFPQNVRCKYVVLHIGNNNSGNGYKPEFTAAGIDEIIKTIHANSPSTHIILLSILPVGANNDDRARILNNKVNAINKETYTGRLDVTYYDIYDRFVNGDGTLKGELYVGDNMHLSALGYALEKELLLEVIEPELLPLPPEEEDNPAIIPVQNPDAWWTQRHEQIVEVMSKEDYFDIVFIGGSTTQLWEQEGIASWNALKPQYKIANLGFGGDRTENALWRLRNGEFPKNVRCKYVVLHIGNNNSGNGYKPEFTAAGIDEIIKTIHANSPSTHIILLSILPVGANNDDRARILNNKVNAINKETYTGRLDVTYYDIYDRFVNGDGTLKGELYVGDNMHLSALGYALEKELLLKILE